MVTAVLVLLEIWNNPKKINILYLRNEAESDIIVYEFLTIQYFLHDDSGAPLGGATKLARLLF